MHTPHRSSALRLVVVAVVVTFFWPGFAAAQATSEEPWYRQLTLNGLLSTTFSYNFNRPPSGSNQFRVFDFDDDTFKVDVIELSVQTPVAKAGDAGFRVDAEAGQSIPRVSAAYGLFRDSSGRAQDFDLKQAYVSYVAPLGRGLRLDAGKFVTAAGYEVIEGYDGYNDNVTRSFLFGYAIPFTHTGVKATYPFSDSLSALLMVVNGWDDARDNNRSKSVGAQVSYAPNAALSVSLFGMTGPEGSDDDSHSRTLFDLVTVWHATGQVTLGLNGDYGSEDGAVVEGKTATWRGAALYVKVRLGGRSSLALRVERFDDVDGARTGVAQRLSEITLTPEVHPTDHLVVRTDLRLDRSDRSVFEKANGTSRRQATICANVIYVF
jgi:hypothetical protein